MKHRIFLRISALLFAMLMVLATGCTTATPIPETKTEPKEPATQLANPMQEVSSLEALNDAVGCCILQPYQDLKVTEERFTVIHGEPVLAQYSFRSGDVEWTLRAGITKEDISGVYVNGNTATSLIPSDQPYAIVAVEGGKFCRWFLGGMQYALLAQGKVAEDDMSVMRDCFALQFPWYYVDYDDMAFEPYPVPDMGGIGCESTIGYHNMSNEKNKAWGTSFGTGFDAPYLDGLSYDLTGLTITEVSTVNELLDAICPGAVIRLAPGRYDLCEAKNYGSTISGSAYYHWEEVYDGFQLVLDHVDNLTLVGSCSAREDGTVMLESVITAGPRYANVLELYNSSNVTLAYLTLGHTLEPGSCAGGVVRATACNEMYLTGCDLYGCGVLGLDATDCHGIYLTDTYIHDCSDGFMSLFNCTNVQCNASGFYSAGGTGFYLWDSSDLRFADCDFSYNYGMYSLFSMNGSTHGITVDNALVSSNNTEMLLYTGEDTAAGIIFNGGALFMDFMDHYEPISLG